MNKTSKILFSNRYRSILFEECKRFAGHSKWQNIKHTKMEKDAERGELFLSLTNKMRIAIREGGGSPDPEQNSQLKKVLNQARQANMPVSSIKTALEKLKAKGPSKKVILELRGPGNCALVVFALTDNIAETTNAIKSRAKKHRLANLLRFVEPSIMFEYACYITAKKDCDLEKAMEDAVNINAMDVEEVKDGEEIFFKFKNEFNSAEVMRTQLEGLGYSLISVNHEITPNTTVTITEEDMIMVNKIKEKLLFVEEIEKIIDNIEES